MKKEDIEKYIANFSHELQEKARACKNVDELKKLIAENNIELPEDALEAVSGGFEATDEAVAKRLIHMQRIPICPTCGQFLRLAVRGYLEKPKKRFFICTNPNCEECKTGQRFEQDSDSGEVRRIE